MIEIRLGKWVRIPRGPAAVLEESLCKPLKKFGKGINDVDT